MPDPDGYPTDEELDRIKTWPMEDRIGWFNFIRSCWMWPDWGWKEEENVDDLFKKPVHRYRISTGGWSGNESIIEAMMKNAILWAITWVQSRKGGHFIFDIRLMESKDDELKP